MAEYKKFDPEFNPRIFGLRLPMTAEEQTLASIVYSVTVEEVPRAFADKDSIPGSESEEEISKSSRFEASKGNLNRILEAFEQMNGAREQFVENFEHWQLLRLENVRQLGGIAEIIRTDKKRCSVGKLVGGVLGLTGAAAVAGAVMFPPVAPAIAACVPSFLVPGAVLAPVAVEAGLAAGVGAAAMVAAPIAVGGGAAAGVGGAAMVAAPVAVGGGAAAGIGGAAAAVAAAANAAVVLVNTVAGSAAAAIGGAAANAVAAVAGGAAAGIGGVAAGVAAAAAPAVGSVAVGSGTAAGIAGAATMAAAAAPVVGPVAIGGGVAAGVGGVAVAGAAVAEVALLQMRMDETKAVLMADQLGFQYVEAWFCHTKELIDAMEDLIGFNAMQSWIEDLNTSLSWFRHFPELGKEKYKLFESVMRLCIRRMLPRMELLAGFGIFLVPVVVTLLFVVFWLNRRNRFVFTCLAKVQETTARLNRYLQPAELQRLIAAVGAKGAAAAELVALATAHRLAMGAFAGVGFVFNIASVVLAAIDIQKGCSSKHAQEVENVAQKLQEEFDVLKEIYTNLTKIGDVELTLYEK